MAVDDVDGAIIGNRDMVRLYPSHLAVLLVQGVDGKVPPSPSSLVEQPEIGQGGWQRAGDFPETPVPEIWQEVVEDREEEQDIGRCERAQKHIGVGRVGR